MVRRNKSNNAFKDRDIPLMTYYPPPQESYLRLFFRFLRFGLLAWGGPVAQIAMIRQELVEEEKWISREGFNRVLAVYQAIPGPEGHELCVYFGMLARGRIGGFLAGLGFMLPGFVLMFGLSYFYVTFGIASPIFSAVLYGCQPAVAVLIVRAVHRIGQHAITNRWLWMIAIFAGIANLLRTNFLLTLIIAGFAYILIKRWQHILALVMCTVLLVGMIIFSLNLVDLGRSPMILFPGTTAHASPSILSLFGYGLRSGLLTFGGAYTVIPFLQRDAVVTGGWMTNAQFMDGLALSGILPAPLIIFATFVGYLGGGPWGALIITVGIFLPAFAFTLLGYEYLEMLVNNKALQTFLDGVTAGVVGLIAATTLGLLRTAITSLSALGIFVLALFVLYWWKAKVAVAVVMLGAGAFGFLLFR